MPRPDNSNPMTQTVYHIYSNNPGYATGVHLNSLMCKNFVLNISKQINMRPEHLRGYDFVRRRDT